MQENLASMFWWWWRFSQKDASLWKRIVSFVHHIKVPWLWRMVFIVPSLGSGRS